MIGLKELHLTSRQTAVGNLLAQYWFPIWFSSKLRHGEIIRRRLLGRDVVIYRTQTGRLGITYEHCTHRGASLAYGMVENDGIRCAYHGVLAGLKDVNGQFACSEQPNRDLIAIREMGGLIFAWVGGKPVADIHAYQTLSEPPGRVTVSFAHLPCNWLQVMENALDPLHLEWLHGHYVNYLGSSSGVNDPDLPVSRQAELAFDRNELGLVKRRILEGQPKTEEDWTIGQNVVFPCVLVIASPGYTELQFRVPMDDNSTFHIWYKRTEDPGDSFQINEVRLFNSEGTFDLSTIEGQDAMAWCTQGLVADRAAEHLLPEDKGIVIYRELLCEQAEALAAGREIMARTYNPSTIHVIGVPKRTQTRPVVKRV